MFVMCDHSTGARVVPYDRAGQRLACLAAPHHGRLALIGDAYTSLIMALRNDKKGGSAPMTFTLLRSYPASSKLAMACSMTLSHTPCISVASCSCHLIRGDQVRDRKVGVE